MSICGIYILEFSGTDKVYVGQSRNIVKRFSEHTCMLLAGRHQYKLTEAFKKFGLPSFRTVLECTPEELNESELEAIQIFDAVNNGFNIATKPGFIPEQFGENSYNSHHTNQEYEKIFLALTKFDKSIAEISKEFNVSISIIRSIAQGHNHKWLQNKYPELYNKLLERKGTWNYKYAFSNKPIKLRSPKGDIVEVLTSISKFSKINNLHPAHLGKVLSGEYKSHKGWKLHKDS
jgi:hypothetical protein